MIFITPPLTKPSPKSHATLVSPPKGREGGSETRHYRVRRRRDCSSRGSGQVSIFFHQGDLCETPSVERRTPSQPSPADWGRGRRACPSPNRQLRRDCETGSETRHYRVRRRWDCPSTASGRRVRANGSPGCLHKVSVVVEMVVEMSVGRAISVTVSLELTGLI